MNVTVDHDATVIVECDSGYTSGSGISTTELTCVNGSFSPSPPTCFENCDLEAVPKSNQTMNVTVDHDATVIVECDSGYTSGSGISTTELTCVNGSFSPSPPTCFEKCFVAVPFSDYAANVSVHHEEIFNVTCSSGYSTGVSLFTELSCNDGTLSPAELPTCYENCNVSAIDFSDYSTSVQVKHSAVFNVTCNQGYSTGVSRFSEFSCNDGILSSAPPTCYENCKIPSIPNSDYSSGGDVQHIATITVTCNQGYSTGVSGFTDLTCDDGTFSPSPPTCYENCMVTVPLSDYSANVPVDHGERFNVTCNPGYSFDSASYLELSCDNSILSPDPLSSCNDIDECALDSSLCTDGRCFNLIGNYTCICNSGFVLTDLHSCTGMTTDMLLLFHKTQFIIWL
ncbi:fibrillin-2-like [Lytechinus variegatus]|uniref:fibrillin-2-like n=1 Tax=Lytechinus variegatus TaxID=7654 RepID=UPI001BB255BA|nr:fibrillin-2-like [Lytechinus variegatus]